MKKKLLLAGVLSLLLAGCGKNTSVYTKTDTAMGTIVQQTLYGKQDVTKSVLSVIESLEDDTLSWRVPESEISLINTAAGRQEGISISASMQTYLNQILDVSEKSHGALDPTIGKITRLWDIDDGNTNLPEDTQIQTLLSDTGYQHIKLNDDTLTLPADMSLDLGAIGKGIACDSVYDYLARQKDLEGAVVSIGGSITVYGHKPNQSSWNVAITHPREKNTYLGTVKVSDGTFISTSGDYERYVEVDGVRYHHIMDPHTGYPARSGVCSVTIVTDSGLLSDALSTACFVLGVTDGLKLAEQYHAEALFVTDDQTLAMTDGMKKIFTQAQ